MTTIYQPGLVTFIFLSVLLLSYGCDKGPSPDHRASNGPLENSLPCDIDNGGLMLPAGFCVQVVADSLGFIRHLVINNNGDIYVTLRNQRLNLGGLMGLRDTNGDAKIDQFEKISDVPGMGIALQDNFLYFATDRVIYRYVLNTEKLIPEKQPQIVVQDLPNQSLHAGKPIVIDDEGALFVNIGAPSNACQVDDELKGSPGIDPCPELDQHAAIWRFSLNELNQTQKSHGKKYAGGIRNAYALAWHPVSKQIYIVQHGRDQLKEQWPDLYTEEEGARLPAEEFLLVSEDSMQGWPYCYFDQIRNQHVLAPEYGGDGTTVGRCGHYPVPLIAFPGHFGPNDLKFYTGHQFPARYHNGAFIAFHGSYNRGTLGQAGYQVVFVPFKDNAPTGEWEVFIEGFAGKDNLLIPEEAEYRPTGLAVGPDGSLYIADSVQGRIWRVRYIGNTATDN